MAFLLQFFKIKVVVYFNKIKMTKFFSVISLPIVNKEKIKCIWLH